MANYNSTLQTNNTDLQAILNQINELPEAGGKDPVLQDKTVSPTTSQQTITADSGYDGLSKVTVNAMPTATQATPSITVSSSGLITASATQTAGYVAAGTKSATKQLTTQAAKTITPSTSSQTAVAKNVYTTGAITVGAIPSTYVKPTTTKAATTYTPTTSNQTIAAGTYCSGAQTIKGDSNLVAGNIKSGVSIFGVDGSYEGSGSAGGASVETCSIEIMESSFYQLGAFDGTINVYYSHVDDDGKINIATATFGIAGNLFCDVVRNSLIFFEKGSGNDTPGRLSVVADSTLLHMDDDTIVFHVTSDDFIDVYQ